MREFIIPTEIPEEIEFYEEYKCEELVRCKDCKWRFDLYCPMFDGETNHVPDPNWYCADGEKDT